MGEITDVYEGGEFEFVFWDGGADVWVSLVFFFPLFLVLGDVFLDDGGSSVEWVLNKKENGR